MRGVVLDENPIVALNEIIGLNADDDLFVTIFGSLNVLEKARAMIEMVDYVTDPDGDETPNRDFLILALNSIPEVGLQEILAYDNYAAFRIAIRSGILPDFIDAFSRKVDVHSHDDMVKVSDLEFLASSGDFEGVSKLLGLMNRRERIADIRSTLDAAMASDEAGTIEVEDITSKVLFVTACDQERYEDAKYAIANQDSTERSRWINIVARGSVNDSVVLASRLDDEEVTLINLVKVEEDALSDVLAIVEANSADPNFRSFFSYSDDIIGFILDIKNLAAEIETNSEELIKMVTSFIRLVTESEHAVSRGVRIEGLMFEEFCKEYSDHHDLFSRAYIDAYEKAEHREDLEEDNAVGFLRIFTKSISDLRAVEVELVEDPPSSVTPVAAAGSRTAVSHLRV